MSILAVIVGCTAFGNVTGQSRDKPKNFAEVIERFETAATTKARVRALSEFARFTTSKARVVLLDLLKTESESLVRAAIYRQLGRHVHASVLKKLSSDFDLRKDAAELKSIADTLARQGSRGESVLIGQLNAKNPDRQSAAVRGLRFLIENKTVSRALAKAFSKAGQAVRIQILDSFGKLRNKKEYGNLLLAATRVRDDVVRANALRRMRSCSNDKILAHLKREFATNKDSKILLDTAYGLSGQGKAGVTVLLNGLQSESEAVRAAAVHGLGASEKSSVTLRAMILSFDEAKPANQAAILRAMAGYEETRALEELRLRALHAKSPNTRAEALVQLADSDHPETKDAALDMSKDEEVMKRSVEKAMLVYALGMVLDRDLLPLFLRLNATPNYQTSIQIRRLLNSKKSPLLSILAEHGMKLERESSRVAVVSLLASAETDETSRVLVDALSDRSPQVVSVAVRALVKRKDRRVNSALQESLRSEDEDRRLQALLSLHKLHKKSASWPRQVLKVLKRGRGAIRFLALDILAELRYRPALKEAHTMIADEAWQIRSSAYDFCRHVRDVSSIPLIIAQLPNEQGRVRAEALATLRSLTLLTYREPSQWKRWWDAVGKKFALPPAPKVIGRRRGPPDVMTYYSIPLTSKAVCFIIDVSGSMREKVGTAKITRLQAAKDALKYVIDKCDPDFNFNLIPFSDRGKAWKASLEPADPENKADARKFIKSLRAVGGTNVFDALQQAFADKGIDTIYVLSDGQPSTGRITDEDDLADEVQLWNTKRRVIIHTISIGRDSSLMQRLSQESGGTYVRRL